MRRHKEGDPLVSVPHIHHPHHLDISGIEFYTDLLASFTDSCGTDFFPAVQMSPGSP